MTAACNVFLLAPWIRVTNLRNKPLCNRKIMNRLHPRMKRLVDMSRSSAKKLNYLSSGLTRIKLEVLEKQKPRLTESVEIIVFPDIEHTVFFCSAKSKLSL